MEQTSERLAVQESVIRLALRMMAIDPTSPLLPKQREWIGNLGKRTTPFTDMQRARIALHLLPWFHDRWPRIYATVREQFEDVIGERRPQEDVSHDL
jgi:hypothetical protein